MIRNFTRIFNNPVQSWREWGVIVIVALCFAFMPQLPYNDWARNTNTLYKGINIYQDPNYVYPPWGLLMLWPYRLITDVGARIASVLVIGGLAQHYGWRLRRFFAVIINPFFFWTMLLSNADVLTFLLPVLLWESKGKYATLRKTLALLLLAVKPQGAVLLVLYWVWQERRITLPMVAAGIVIVFFSVIGSPPLLIQWLHNITHPSADNQGFWTIDNVSLTAAIGFIPSAIIVALAAYRWRRYKVPVLIWSAMLLSPYTSNQSVSAPLALVSSWPATIFQFVVLIGMSALGVYRQLNPLWALLFGIVSFVLLDRQLAKTAPKTDATPPQPESV